MKSNMTLYLEKFNAFNKYKMFVKGSNTCMWVFTRKPGKFYCGQSCIGEYCHIHNHLINNKKTSAAQPCVKCGINGTRSKTGLCQNCGASNVTSKAWYTRKKKAA